MVVGACCLQVRDLLAPEGLSNNGSGGSGIAIRECPDGQIVVTGAREEVAASKSDLIRLLELGSMSRATSSTAINSQSSRSHAIFTIVIEQSINSPSSSSSSSSGAPGDTDSAALTPRGRMLQQLQGNGGTSAPGSGSRCAGLGMGRRGQPSPALIMD